MEHLLSDATPSEIAERWGISVGGVAYWRNKVKAENQQRGSEAHP